MDYEAFLFDLDGTLIDFDLQIFIKTYLGAASQFFIDLIPNPEIFYKELLSSTDVMEKANNPNTTALDDFLLDFCPKFEVNCDEIRSRFLQFYQTGFNAIKPLITQMDGAIPLLQDIKDSYPNAKVVLATNPVYPFIAIEKRMEWGEIPQKFFDLITHAENSNFCKLNNKYWFEILGKINTDPSSSLVIGNDGLRDMGAKKQGFKTFLVENASENEDLITSDTKPDFKGSLKDLHDHLI
ncbi:MAG: HAD family hydrolase [Candidatus Heimdallarchaeota archaeon]|nr:HAD family hydrolase [Candidatus Heimdallarchaeota archaeon]MCK4878563.1 HAD family hydrolase [Candidatus Heimdallarchaeota archaeon]